MNIRVMDILNFSPYPVDKSQHSLNAAKIVGAKRLLKFKITKTFMMRFKDVENNFTEFFGV